MKNILYLGLLLLISYIGIAQNSPKFHILEGDTINIVDENGQMQGLWKVFGRMKKLSGYSPDQLVEYGMYKNNLRQGLWEHLDVNGDLEFTSYYIDGVDTINGAKNHLHKNLYIKQLQISLDTLKEQLNKSTKEKAQLIDANIKLKSAQEKLQNATIIKYTLFVFIGLLIIIILILYSAYRKNRAK